MTVEAIKQRILDEHKKHSTLDWAEIAARKIYSAIYQDDEFLGKAYEVSKETLKSKLNLESPLEQKALNEFLEIYDHAVKKRIK